jgi:hypothetical protein
MKKLAYLIVLTIAASIVLSQAQAQKIHNPDVKAAVTTDQIKAWGAPMQQESSNLVPLTFEGLGNLDEISQFYNGGTSSAGFSGTNHGIYFSKNALAIINMDNGGGTGNFTNTEWSHTAMFFLSGGNVTMNDPKGFTDALSIQYISSGSGTVSLYDELDGTGNLLASLILPATTSVAKGKVENGNFNKWKHLGVSFSGMAKSVTFSGTANQCAFDNIILGSDKTPGPGEAANAKPGESGKAPQATFVASGDTHKSPATKGKLFLAGTSALDLNIGKQKEKSGGSVVEGSELSYMQLDFQPKAGYFVINNLVAGLFIDMYMSTNKDKDPNYGYTQKETKFIIGPFARYYIPVCDKLIPFVEGQVGFGVDNYKSKSVGSSDWSKSKESVFTYRIGGGATYFFNDIVGADLFLGYLHDSYKYKDTGGGERSSDSKYLYNDFVLQLGIVVILDF